MNRQYADEIVSVASEAYGDGFEIEEAWKTGEPVGDGLATFIAAELGENCAEHKTLFDALDAAIHLMETARDELDGVIEALYERRAEAERNGE